jgi:hydrogenase maturation protein HypF
LFEAEPAMLLEAISEEDVEDSYPIDIKASKGLEIDLSPTIIAIVRDIQKEIPKGVIASKFHNTLSEAVLRVVLRLSYINSIDRVVLSGGVFQNIFLLKRLFSSLKGAGLKVFINESVPSNDGGLSLGQAFYAAMRLKDERQG